MGRTVAIMLWLVASCGRGTSQLPVKPLPELVAPSGPATAVVVKQLLLVPDEKLIFDVQWRGLTIGRAEMVVAAEDVYSRFHTGKLVSSVTSVHHELRTLLDREAAHPKTITETLELDGETKHVEAIFDEARYTIVNEQPRAVPGGNHIHTLHTALGAIRTWAHPQARAGFLFILHAGEAYRLDMKEPIAEELHDKAALRIDCRTRGSDGPISITIWLTADPNKTPLRVELSNDQAKLTAELVDV